MSDFLLKKSCKLLSDSKGIKKVKRSEKQRFKKKKNCVNLKQLEEETFEYNILNNLKKLEDLNRKTGVDVSEKAIPKHRNKVEADFNDTEEEGSTVFTEKDFEDFEKEYFDS